MNTLVSQIIVSMLVKAMMAAAGSIDWNALELEIQGALEKVLPKYDEVDKFLSKTIVALLSSELTNPGPGKSEMQLQQMAGQAFNQAGQKLVPFLAQEILKKN